MTTQPLEPGFMLIHGNRAEELCDVAIDWLVQNPLHPLEPEVILVQSAGVAQWLRQKMAYAGIAAALDFVLPASFAWRAYKSVLSTTDIPDQAVLDKDKLVWQLFRLLDNNFGEGSAIGNFLADNDIRKKFQLAQHLAGLYDQYQVYRADWLNLWEQHKNIIVDNRNTSTDLKAEQEWQADLWRMIIADTESIHGNVWGRARIHKEFMERLLDNNSSVRYPDLPQRIVVFGISTMPRQILETLVVLSSRVQVLVFINNPCQHYWGDIQGQHEILRSSLKRHQKKPNIPIIIDVDNLHEYAQPLLASWGRQGRDFIAMLDDFDTPDRRQKSVQLFAGIEQKIDIFTELPGDNLLEQIQDDIRDLRPASESSNWPPVSIDDNSIQFHVVYGKQRELEVLHDQILAAFDQDKNLRPSDVLVMVPDIGSYAAHIESVFGQYEIGDKRYLPYAIADRGQRNIDPLVVVLEKLLGLPGSRFGAKEILDLLDVPALRQKFDIQEEHLPLIRLWVEQSNIRWGINQEHKSSFTGSVATNENTWDFGLSRMLLGYATGSVNSSWCDVFPYAEPGGMQSVALGYLANYLDKLSKYRKKLQAEHDPETWIVILNDLVDDFFLPDNTQDEATVLRFKQVLQDWFQICLDTGYAGQLPIGIVADFCLDQLDQAHDSPRFFAGAITFATLMPMRAIPFRHICLLGMQDGDFPRTHTPDDFDLMPFYPRPGDRSRREDDRYLFLEALLSARDQLYISWVGMDINDNSEQPPSILVSQLIDHIDTAWKSSYGQHKVSKLLTTYHPLQPFSKKYFWQENLSEEKYFTYAHEWQKTLPATRIVDDIQPQMESAVFGLSDLKGFLRSPVRYFYNHVLGIYFNNFMADLNEDETYDADGLIKWRIKNGILGVVEKTDNSDEDIHNFKQNLVKQGFLPSGNTASFVLQDIDQSVNPVINVFTRTAAEWPELNQPVVIDTMLANGARFHDTVYGLRSDGQGNYRKLILLASNAVAVKKNPVYEYKHIVSAWVEHIALNYWFDAVETVLATPKGIISFDIMDSASAGQIWDELWSAFIVGLARPIAADPELSYMWLMRKNSDDISNLDSELAAAYEEKTLADLYYAHAFRDFDDFFENGEFNKWSESLYGGIRSRLNSYNIDGW